MNKKQLKYLSNEILKEQKEVIQQGGIRIQVVETDKIKAAFEKQGLEFINPF